MSWLVFWKRNGRVGSIALTPENQTEMHKRLHLTLLQTDADGSQHWEILGIKRGGLKY